MTHKTQSANMQTLGALLMNDLGYIHGERESGPNGAKRQFLSKGRAFMSVLGKDLGFSEMKVNVNKAGIAVSGEIYLYGMWPESMGLHLCLQQDLMSWTPLLYRTIKSMNDHTGGRNNYISIDMFAYGDYDRLLEKLLMLKEAGHGRQAA